MTAKPVALFTGTSQSPMESREQQILPTVSPEERKDPAKYRTEPDLVAAVNVAITLGMPLLITGEPGCGKSQLAYRVAWELGFVKHTQVNGKQIIKADLEKFSVKSTTESGDLFYTFDTIGRFHASRNGDKTANGDNASTVQARNFIHYQALGKAILNGLGRNQVSSDIISDKQKAKLDTAPRRSVVLIDEIDKAPRDVPNDILNEIDNMEFSIPELQRDEPLGLPANLQHNRPIVIITSNSERDLPEAFLRRCVFYHLAFPLFEQDLQAEHNSQDNSQSNEPKNTSNRVTVEDILQSQFPEYFSDSNLRASAIALMRLIRQHATAYYKAPSMAEFINCFDFLFKYCIQQGIAMQLQQSLQAHFTSPAQKHILSNAVNQTLFKNTSDMQLAKNSLDHWLASSM